MDTWTEQIFNNKEAQNWLYEFSIYPGINLVEMSLYIVLKERNTINITHAREGLIACEVIARIGGYYTEKNIISEAIDNWVDKNPTRITDTLRTKALCTIDKILGSQSELMHLQRDNVNWLPAVKDLKKRLKQ
jgi:hypothetical protein